MKKILTYTAIVALGFGVFSSCKKKSSTPSESMKATIGSTSFSTSNCLSITAAGTLTITGWTGTGTTASAPEIVIEVINWSGSTGTITMDSTMATGYEEYVPSLTSSSSVKTGTVDITSVSTSTIVGTFSFTGTDGTVVSNGTFTAKRD